MARFDAISHLYDWLPIPTHADRLARALDGVPAPRLDVGGGTGRFTVAIHGDDGQAVVLDASAGMLARARAAGRGLAGVRGVGQAMPFPGGSFHAVTITEAFHHFAPHQEAVLAECARVLVPGGRLLIEEIDPGRALGRLIAWGENALLRFGSRFLEPQDLVELIGAHLDEVDWERTGSFTYLVEARKAAPGSLQP